ncbi:MAG: acetyltransferase [Desulfurivibrio sp.]|nr:acetyltransferase [Desulfurivibrio sp.]
MTAYFDIFNGDADGICALQQLRLAAPRPQAELITGVKRDIELVGRLLSATPAAELAGAEITVLDISLERNRPALATLPPSCRLFYADHHYAGEIPAGPNREFHIDPDSQQCTALIVDRLLAGRYRAWAVVGAFGDNLHDPARRAAAELGLAGGELEELRELGELLNYNGYGQQLADLHFPPATLYRELAPYPEPLAFCRRSAAMADLRRGFAADLGRARELTPLRDDAVGRVYQLPPRPWARRVNGVFANELARSAPDRAHALLVEGDDDHFLVSVRAPWQRPSGADTLCRRFPGGGGRAAAAGINGLPAAQIPAFLAAFSEIFQP